MTTTELARKQVLVFALIASGCGGGMAVDTTADEATSSALTGAPALNYSGPIVISSPGTYTGNYRSPSAGTAAIEINTTGQVIIQNCNLVGPGALIHVGSGASLVVRNCNGYGEGPTPGPFIDTSNVKSIDVQSNYVEHVSKGVLVYQFRGNGSPSETIRVIGNIARNLYGPYKPSFLQFNQVIGVANVELAYNQVINEPGKSSVEDNFNFYNSSGTVSSRINFHDNYVQGAYPLDLNAPFTGTGMTSDGDGTLAMMPANLLASNNIFLSTCDSGMNLAGGYNIRYTGNHIITSAQRPDGSGPIPSTCTWAGAAAWNYFNLPAGSPYFTNNSIDNNVVGYVNRSMSSPFAGRQDFSTCFPGMCSANTSLPNPITLDTEKSEWARWNTKIAAAGITLGSSANSNDGTRSVGNGSNPFWGSPSAVTTQPPTPGTATISSFTLINASTDSPQPLDGIAGHSAVITENSVVNLAIVGQALNIRADVGSVPSVVFNLDNGALSHAESAAPYALASDSNGNYNAWTPTLGAHALGATAFSGSGGSGTAGSTLLVHFSVTNATTPGPAPSDVPPAGTLPLHSVKSGSCMDVQGGSTADGASVIQYACSGNSNQLFTFLPAGSGRYQVQVQSSAKCLNVSGGSTASGALITQMGCSASQLDQLFTVEANSAGGFAIVSVKSAKCIDVYGGSTANYAHIQQWDCNGLPQQGWK